MYTSKTYSNGWHYGELTRIKGTESGDVGERVSIFTESGKERCVYDKRIFEQRSK